MSDQQAERRDINRIELRGRLGRDAEVRTTQGGMKIVTLAVATSENWRDRRTQEWKSQTEWHRVGVMFNDEAVALAEDLRKGQRVRLLGKMTYREWTDQSGAKRTSAEVRVERFGELQLLPDEPGSGRQDRPQQASAPRPAQQRRPPPSNDMDDDIPF